MRIGIMSDSHGDVAAIRRTLAVISPVDCWLHAGDYARDALFLAQLAKLPVTAVAGNTDGMPAAKWDEFIEVSGKKIWLTHGHRYQVKSGIRELAWWGHQYEVQLVVFGHTHVPQITTDGQLLLVNPGSVALPGIGRKPTIALIDITATGQFRPRIVEIDTAKVT